MNAPVLAFAADGLDRADHLRSDPEALARHMDARARLLLLDGLDPVTDAQGALAWGSLADAPDGAELVFLGLDDEHACFAAAAPPAAGSTAPPNPRLWQTMATLDARELAIYGGARSLVDWHARHRFCARCGASTRLAKGGWQRTCTSEACNGEHFPRVDPVTIMLVEHEDCLLLGRQPRFPAGSYSALAGFIEPGETVEGAVAREVLEEAGVTVSAVSYVMSQPWPFPSSLMIGCHAMASGRDLRIDYTELEDARWFTREEVVEALSASDRGEPGKAFTVPRPVAVAHHLIRWWTGRTA